MRYKDYIWPSNPGSYRISFRRVVAEHKLPERECYYPASPILNAETI